MMIALAHFQDRSGAERRLRVVIGGSGLAAILLISLAGTLLAGQV